MPDWALGIFRNPGPDLCVQGRRILEFITGCSECLSFPHCQYTADLDTFQEIFRSEIIGNYDCEKGLLALHVVFFFFFFFFFFFCLFVCFSVTFHLLSYGAYVSRKTI